jgi:hypothetical protein
VTAEISVDDVPAERVTFRDGVWRRVQLRLPPPGTRRVRRIDVRLDRVRAQNHGVQIGEISTR